MRLWSFLSTLIFLAPLTGQADSIDGRWSIVGFSGEAWFLNPQSLIGRTQEFSGGFSSGPLHNCDFAGQSSTYTTYENDDFFANPEFRLFAAKRDGMTFSSSKLFVHRITCNGRDDPMTRRVLYPLVTNEARVSAWYLYEGGIVELFRP